FGHLLHSKYQLIKSTHGVFGSEHVSSIVHQAVQRRDVLGSCTQEYHGKLDQGAELGVGEISGNVGSKVGKQVEPSSASGGFGGHKFHPRVAWLVHKILHPHFVLVLGGSHKFFQFLTASFFKGFKQ